MNRKLSLPLILLFVGSMAFAQAPAQAPAQGQVNPAPQVEPEEDARPIGARLSEAAAEFTRAVTGVERGQGDVTAAEDEASRLKAELAAAQAATTGAELALAGVYAGARSAAKAVIALLEEYLGTLPSG